MFLNRFFPNHPRKKKCEEIWTKGIGLGDHWPYVACARSVMNDVMEFEKIIIYPKVSHKNWVRDIWLTSAQWAPRDFLLHDLEQFKITDDQKLINSTMHAYFSNPFLSDALFHSLYCVFPEGLKSWKYNSTFIKSDEFIDAKIQKKADEARIIYYEILKKLGFHKK